MNHRRSAPVGDYFLKSFNPVVKILIISDIAIVGGGGLIGPVFALFIENFIVGGNAATAGIAAAVFLFTKSLCQIPSAHIIDKIRGEKDDFWFLFSASVLMSLIPLLYLLVDKPVELYVVQFLYGVIAATTFPSFMSIFTKHIDKGREGVEWGVYFTMTDLISAAFASVGGLLAVTYGYHYLIIVVSAMQFMGAMLIYPIKRYIKGVR